MSHPFDPARFRDPHLRPIAEKVVAQERLSPEDGERLYLTDDLISLGELADWANQRRNGDRVFF